jgi:transposase
MISRDMYYRIHFLKKNKLFSTGQIAGLLGLSEKTVRYWLKQAEFHERKERQVGTRLDGFRGQIDKLLDDVPSYTAMQIYQMLAADGYDGSYETVKRYAATVRPAPRKAYFALSFSKGEAVQVDFAACGKIPCDNTERRLSVFVMVLCYSRYLFAEFIPCERQEHFLACHWHAFREIGGVPRRVIVDNCKCAVSSNRRYEKPVYNPTYLDFAGRCGFSPDACTPGRPNEKGMVENSVRYIKNNFMSGRNFGSLAEANTALRHWLETIANVRVHSATGRTPLDMLAEERAALGKLPESEPDCAAVRHCRADKRCRVWFDSNSYSVPSRCALAPVTVKARPEEVVIYMNNRQVARHRRCYGRKTEVIDPDHLQQLKAIRRKANQQNLIRDFLSIGPEAEKFMQELESRELNASLHMRKIVSLVEGEKTRINAMYAMF